MTKEQMISELIAIEANARLVANRAAKLRQSIAGEATVKVSKRSQYNHILVNRQRNHIRQAERKQAQTI
jgi:hypothetical protein